MLCFYDLFLKFITFKKIMLHVRYFSIQSNMSHSVHGIHPFANHEMRKLYTA